MKIPVAIALAAMLCICSCTTGTPWGDDPASYPVVFCGGNTMRVIDMNRSEGDDVLVLWEWTTEDKDFLPLDDCKPVGKGEQIMVTSSKRAAALVSSATGKISFNAVTPMAHSIEYLPKRRVAVALSTNPQGNSLEIYDISNPQAPLIRDTMYSGHGVVWNKKNKRLYTLNYNELREYKLCKWNSRSPSMEQVASWDIPGNSGHDLSYVDASHLLVTCHEGVFLFNLSDGTFSEFEPMKGMENVKSVNYDPVTGRIVYTIAEISWWTHHIYQKNPDKVVNVDDVNVYKVRTFGK